MLVNDINYHLPALFFKRGDGEMIPATTPTFIIKLKNADNYIRDSVNIKVYIRQQDVLLVKEMKDLVIDAENNSIGITLTQKESSKFLYKKGNIEFQVHGLLLDNETAWKTYVVETPVDKTLTKDLIQ